MDGPPGRERAIDTRRRRRAAREHAQAADRAEREQIRQLEVASARALADLRENPEASAERAARRLRGQWSRGLAAPKHPFDIAASDATRLVLRKILSERVGRDTPLPTIVGAGAMSRAVSQVPGGRPVVFGLIQLGMLDGLPNCVAWWEVYAQLLPAQRLDVAYEDICAAAGVQPKYLMAEVITVAMENGDNVSTLVAELAKPVVVTQLVKSAKRIGGQFADVAQKDRHAFLQARGFLPAPKNAVTTVQVHASATAAAAAAAQTTADPSVPSFAASMEAMRTVRQSVQQQLLAERTAPEAQELVEEGTDVLDGVLVGEED